VLEFHTYHRNLPVSTPNSVGKQNNIAQKPGFQSNIPTKFGLTNSMKQTKFGSSWISDPNIESSETFEN
jgi:hypothetical protein